MTQLTVDEWMNELSMHERIQSEAQIRQTWQVAQAAALRSPAPAATVAGWRLVESEEILQSGDEIWSDHDYAWNPLTVGIGHKKTYGCPVRRRLTPPALDAVTAVDAIEWLMREPEFESMYNARPLPGCGHEAHLYIRSSIFGWTRDEKGDRVEDSGCLMCYTIELENKLAALAAKELR